MDVCAMRDGDNCGSSLSPQLLSLGKIVRLVFWVLVFS